MLRPRSIFLLLACGLFASLTSAGGSEKKGLPSDLELSEAKPQKYRMTIDWYNRDLHGNATARFKITGDYTRGLGGGTVRWNNVDIAVFGEPDEPEHNNLPQKTMEDMTYKSPDDVAGLGLFSRLPADETRHLLRTLIWDAVTIEVFAWTWFDKLKLNETIVPAEIEGLTVPMADWGQLRMQNLRLTWTGTSSINDENCAVIQYESFVNPVEALGIKGRSLYWGRIFVSLEDKQIEGATLNEDVIMDIAPGTENQKLMNIQREMSLERRD